MLHSWTKVSHGKRDNACLARAFVYLLYATSLSYTSAALRANPNDHINKFISGPQSTMISYVLLIQLAATPVDTVSIDALPQ